MNRGNTTSFGAPSLETLFIAALALFGFRLGAQPIHDNSMFVHLRTGMEIVSEGAIPRVDPYSYTAAGEPWVVQSWLASATYGLLEALGGLRLVVLEQAVLMALLALVVVLLARTGSPLRTAAAGAIALGIGTPYWVPRPLLFGLLGMALLVYIVERGRSAWWLVPLVWVWANSHGSFPLGLAWLAFSGIGSAIDRRSLRVDEVRYSAVFLVGLGAAAINPLGPRILTFPATALERRDMLQTLTEWRSPDFTRPDGMVAAVFIGLAVAVIASRRLPWRYVAPVGVFLVAALLALRNVAVFAIVASPALGHALAAARSAAPSEGASSDPGVRRIFAGVLAAAFALFGISVWTNHALDLSDYPVAAVTWLEEQRLLEGPKRLAHDEQVGAYLILRGTDAGVFVDDRLDMYPPEISRDLDALIAGAPPALGVLDDHDIDAVLWRRGGTLVATLEASEDWERAYSDRQWAVYTRR